MKIDLHTHCKPGSACAHHAPELLPEMFKNKNMDGFVLTNHCYPAHCEKLCDDINGQARAYTDIYRRCREAGEKINIKVFFGTEIKLINEPNRPEFLLYGISEEDFIESFPLYNSTQKELFDFCNEKNILMVQAHPYRTEQGYAPADMQYVHGVEVFNPHLLFPPRIEECVRLANENGKIKTSGSDFHVEQQAGLAGVIVDDTVEDQFMLRDFLRSEKQVIFDKNGILEI